MTTTEFEPRRFRENDLQITQMQAAAKADLSLATLAQFERGTLVGARPRTIAKLALAYSVTVDVIKGWFATQANDDRGTEAGTDADKDIAASAPGH